MRLIVVALVIASLASASAASPLTVAADVTTAGSIGLTASDAAAAGDDLTILAGVTVSAGGSLTMNAGDNFYLATTAAAEGSPIAIFIDFGDADPGTGATATILGSLNGVPQATITGGADSDVFIIAPDDTTPITVVGAGGNNSLSYLGSGGVIAFSTATSGVISGIGVADVTFSGISSITGAAPPVPEPGTFALFGVAALGAYVIRRRRKAS